MILADTSAWINHWVVADLDFARLLAERRIVMHPFILGELAMGSLRDRRKTLVDMRRSHMLSPVPHDEVMALIEEQSLFSRGLGFIDTHLLAAALANAPVKILTHDRRFREAAQELGVAA